MDNGFPVQLDIANPFGAAPVYFIEETGSTMEEAVMLAERGVPAGTVIRAGFQSRGRGRIPGRVWSADAGGNLLFTLILFYKGFPISRYAYSPSLRTRTLQVFQHGFPP